MERQAHQLREEAGGVTLAELLVTLVLSLLILGAALALVESTRTSSARTTARQEAVSQAERALARITRETRQATLAAVQGSGILDMKTRVRTAPGADSELRRIRYDCPHGSDCVRKDCGVTSPGGTLVGGDCNGAESVVLSGLESAQFVPQLDGVALAVPPAVETPAIDFITIRLRVRLDDFEADRAAAAGLDPVEITGGVELANVAN